jgi:protein-S-isoprenylcysteine O-methyltransferase Ste14
VQIWFLLSLIGFITVIPIYFLSIEHSKLKQKYGEQKGKRIGEILGVFSGWGFFLFWFGIWFSPQDRFVTPFLENLSIQIPYLNFTLNVANLIVFLPFFIAGAWFGIKGVLETSLKVAETHRAEKINTLGVYSIIRHPQYFGGILAQIGFSILLSATFSFLVTPLVVAEIYLISRKEESELSKEFGKEYENYKTKVPMLLPRNLRRQKIHVF